MNAIVFTSNAGHTAEYAKLLGAKTGLPVYSFKDAQKTLGSNTPIIYLGWLLANNVKGYKKATRKFNICAVCAVGLCDTGTGVSEVRKVNSISDELPLFTMQGGIDKTKLHGINKFMISMLTKSLSSKSKKTKDDEHMLELLTHDKNYVSENNILAFMEWFSK